MNARRWCLDGFLIANKRVKLATDDSDNRRLTRGNLGTYIQYVY